MSSAQGGRSRPDQARGHDGHAQPASTRSPRHSRRGRSGSQCSVSHARTSARTDSGSTSIDSILSHSRTAAPWEHERMHVARAREFFGPRARDWDTRFPDDAPAYARAARDLAPRHGGVVVDLGCGTGRALPALRAQLPVRPQHSSGSTSPLEMLDAARARGSRRRRRAPARRRVALPMRPGAVDTVFAAGLVAHVPDPEGAAAAARRVDAAGRATRAVPSARSGRARGPPAP